MTGDEPLAVVGVEDSQDALWKVAGVPVGSPVDVETYGILLPEADDAAAISVWVGGGQVGYLSREDAERLRPGLLALMRKVGHPLALTGKVVGCSPGMVIFGGVGSLSVTLFHDPADFGLPALSSSGTPWDEGFARSAARPVERFAGMPWADGLPADPAGRVPYLRALLERGKYDLVDRHFMFNFLEEALYKQRDSSPTALSEYDEVCERHHLEMLAGIRAALIDDMGVMPRVPCYHQSAIRWAKARDWEGALLWTERGIGVYATRAGRTDSLEDLVRRAAKYRAKLVEAPPAADSGPG